MLASRPILLIQAHKPHMYAYEWTCFRTCCPPLNITAGARIRCNAALEHVITSAAHDCTRRAWNASTLSWARDVERSRNGHAEFRFIGLVARPVAAVGVRSRVVYRTLSAMGGVVKRSVKRGRFPLEELCVDNSLDYLVRRYLGTSRHI